MSTQPPRLFTRFFKWYCKPPLQEAILGDLEEQFEDDLKAYGVRKAKRRFIWSVIRFFRPQIIKTAIGGKLNHLGMFKNYFKVGIRNILKYKAFSFINTFGLAVAMAVSLLIILMLADQHQYDHFHTKKDRIYRVHTKTEGSGIANASSPFPLARTMKKDYPMVENATILVPGVGGDAVLAVGKYAEIRGFFADHAFFDIFDFELKEGDPNTALNHPNSIVITSEVAYKLFNSQPAIGKTINFQDRSLGLMKIDIGTGKEEIAEEWGQFTITGVIDLSKPKSHIDFDMLISASSLPRLYQENKVTDKSRSWENYSVGYTYLLLREGSTQTQLQESLNELASSKYKEFPQLEGMQLLSRRLNNITPGQFVGNPITLRLPIEAYYVLIGLAIIILLSACLNYTNLSIARMLTRAKEIGVRKVNGARRGSLILQFLTESVITSFLALMMANLILLILRPALKSLWISNVLNFDLTANLTVFSSFLGFALIIGLVAGLYPSLVLSGFAPLKALKNLKAEKPGKIGLRRVLNITQFTFSLFFIVTSILIARQFNHIIDFQYGFDTENVVNIPIQGNAYQILQNEFASISGVLGTSTCEFIPALLHTNGASISNEITEENLFDAEYISIDHNFVSNMGLDIIAGKNLSKSQAEGNAILINEMTIHRLGFDSPQEAIGKTVFMGGQRAMTVQGVIKDVKFQNPVMGEGDLPLILRYSPKLFSYINVRFDSQNQEVMKKLKDKWESIDQTHPFKSYVYDDQLAKSTKWFGDVVAIIAFIASLAVIISCLGLLGMAIYSTERRAKEIGIRKVLGAKQSQLSLALGKSFLAVLTIAILLGGPLSYLANNLWLESFPNRVGFGLGTVLSGSLILFLIGLFTIGFQIITVSRRNPVDALKDE
ncbi:MAG: ABC transporter permease [Ekhidna sp.]